MRTMGMGLFVACWLLAACGPPEDDGYVNVFLGVEAAAIAEAHMPARDDGFWGIDEESNIKLADEQPWDEDALIPEGQ